MKSYSQTFLAVFAATLLLGPGIQGAELNHNIEVRGGLANAHATFSQTGKGHVAFMGGSITQMNGYRPMVMEALKKRFPDTTFTFTPGGLSSTCSTSGAFRLEDHILKHGPVDLLYLEFAVNDDQDAAHDRAACIRGLEGIIRHVRKHNPHADIVVTYFVNDHLMNSYRKNTVATSIAAHEEVTKHYNLSVVNLAREVQEQIDGGKMTWKQFGGVHPATYGNRHCSNMHEALMDATWKAPSKRRPHALPDPIDPANYENGRRIPPAKATDLSGWDVTVPDWKKLPGGFRKDYADAPFLVSTTPGATARLAFTGNGIGAFVLAGPDAGTLESRIDQSEWQSVELFHRHSKGLHYPRSVMFAHGLTSGAHTLEIRVSEKRPNGSKGTAARIMYFGAN